MIHEVPNEGHSWGHVRIDWINWNVEGRGLKPIVVSED
jgi:hypothetical protein